jgi:transcriptional regulator with PAS, ATPase and Fis domain
VQVKLLRVLEERKFERVGGAEEIEVDIRLIAATNKDLRKLVDEGRFREDLFFRLDVVNVTLPPLRDRIDDLPLLCSHFLKEFNEKNQKNVEAITADAVQLLGAYAWPGNVRELRNTVEKMVVLARGNKLTARDIPQNIREKVRGAEGKSAGGLQIGAAMEADSLADAEKRLIFAALKKHQDNRTKAASELGISRRTLHRKLRQYEQEQAGGDE